LLKDDLSIGSIGHDFNACKPCAFFHDRANGCSAGKSCTFCHKCLPNERLRRKKDKKKIFREQRELGRSIGLHGYPEEEVPSTWPMPSQVRVATMHAAKASGAIKNRVTSRDRSQSRARLNSQSDAVRESETQVLSTWLRQDLPSPYVSMGGLWAEMPKWRRPPGLGEPVACQQGMANLVYGAYDRLDHNASAAVFAPSSWSISEHYAKLVAQHCTKQHLFYARTVSPMMRPQEPMFIALGENCKLCPCH